MTEHVDAFITLFRGRADAYGSWDGGCIREPLTRAVFERHLWTGPHIGVYCSVPLNGTAHTVWGCSDIDYDSYAEASLLQATFAAVGVRAWTERTRKGWHVWVFATELVPSADMRAMFLAAHQVAATPPKEVNPKQTDLTGKGLGNYVRLPYPGGDAAVERQMWDGNGPISLGDFLTAAVTDRATPDQIADLAGYYTPPPAPVRVAAEPTLDMAQAARGLTALGRTIFRHGPIEGRDRSTTLAHLAHECFKSGLPPEDGLMLLEDADLRWGKYSMRGETGQLELVKLVQRAYGVIPST